MFLYAARVVWGNICFLENVTVQKTRGDGDLSYKYVQLKAACSEGFRVWALIV